ncbi:helix-turn-helix transcriptional regulator [Streptomyces sp. NPDC054841]
MHTQERTSTAIALAIHATDRITRTGVDAYFRSCERIRVVEPGQEAAAEVLVVLAGDVTEEVLDRMRRAAEQSRNPRLRTVLVANDIGNRQLVRAFDYGLVSFLARQQTTMAGLQAAVWASRTGRTELPGRYVRSLIDQVKAVLRDAPASRSTALAPAGFSQREIDVLRLLAEGMDTAEVAARLHYSERTIKNVLAEMMSRLGLRNRAHAIAYAIQSGVM